MNNNYAGFWLRFVAVIIDSIIIGVVYFIVIAPILGLLGIGMADNLEGIDPENEAEMMGMAGVAMAAMGLAQVLSFVISVLYHTFMETSKFQGSIGKLALGIKVTDINGAKEDFGKALVRNLCKIISSLILLVGYIMAGFTEKKQALHDMIAGTLVVKK